MARVKRGVVSHRKHNKVLNLTKGYRGTRSKLIKVAKEALLHSDAYAYHGRKRRKRDMRRLWITRIGEAVKKDGYSYSVFMNALKTKKIEIDRKILSQLVTDDPDAFTMVVKKAFEGK